MLFPLSRFVLAGCSAAALVWGFANPVQAFSLQGTAGTWSNVQGGSGISSQTVNGESQVRWGTPATMSGSSGLGFTGVGALDFEADDVLQIGTLRHFNNPIWGGTAASAVDLSLSFDLADLGVKTFDFTLTIDETPNSGTCAYESVTPCADRIAWTNSLAAQSFQLDGTDYTLELLGVRESLTGDLLESFISQEGGTSEAFLFAKLTTVEPVLSSPNPPVADAPNSVPEPGLVLGLGAIAAIAVRRRPHAA